MLKLQLTLLLQLNRCPSYRICYKNENRVTPTRLLAFTTAITRHHLLFSRYRHDCASRQALAAYMHHGPGGGNESWLADVVAGFFLVDCTANEVSDLLVAGTNRHESSEVVLANRKQAGANLAVRSHPDTAALSAKWM
jgi:hypothetical protein